MTTQQIQALRMIADAVIESVKAAGSLGAPGGVLYAALMTHGCTLAQFESIMSALVQSGKLTRKGQLYFAVAEKCPHGSQVTNMVTKASMTCWNNECRANG